MVYVRMCVTVLIIEQESINLRGFWRDMVTVGRGKSGNEVSTVLIYEILKNMF